MTWLRRYFGEEFAKLSPSITFEGKNYAVVKLQKTTRGFNGVGFILVDKLSSHSSSRHVSLHEGMPSASDLTRMKAALDKKEEEA